MTICKTDGHQKGRSSRRRIANPSARPGGAAPHDWIDLFRGGSNPATVTNWPPLADVVTALKDQRTRLLAQVDANDDIDKVLGPAPRNRTLRGMVVHAMHDEAGHQGDVHLLKKLAGVKA